MTKNNIAHNPQSQSILIIYTGGTIGMQSSDDGYSPSSGIDHLIQESLSDKSLTLLQPYSVLEFSKLIDSSNAQPNDWLSIAKCIADNYQSYAGFIVLHGTDTMAYTAAALHHILGENIKPVIVTGSQIPMCQARSDGTSNLMEAALFIRSQQVSQVCLSFAGQLIAGYAAKKTHTCAMQAFSSVNQAPLAHANISLTFSKKSSPTKKTPKPETQFKLQSLDEQSVSVLFLYPGISKESIEAALLADSIKAVVLLSFGAGNPPDENQNLISALKQAREKGTVIMNMTQCYEGAVSQGTYAAGSILNKLGVISAEDRTLEDVVTDLYVNQNSYPMPNH